MLNSFNKCFSSCYRWGFSEDVWMKMVSKEQNYRHSKSFMQKHPRIQPRMRSILLDWLIEASFHPHLVFFVLSWISFVTEHVYTKI